MSNSWLKRLLYVLKFFIDCNAKCLEYPKSALGIKACTPHNCLQLICCVYWHYFPWFDNCSSNEESFFLISIAHKYLHKFTLRKRVNKIFCGSSFCSIKSHIERTIWTDGESPRSFVIVSTAHSEIIEDKIYFSKISPRDYRFQLCKTCMNYLKMSFCLCFFKMRFRESKVITIPIKAKEHIPRTHIRKHHTCMPSQSERSIYNKIFAGLGLKDQFNLRKQNRIVMQHEDSDNRGTCGDNSPFFLSVKGKSTLFILRTCAQYIVLHTSYQHQYIGEDFKYWHEDIIIYVYSLLYKFLTSFSEVFCKCKKMTETRFFVWKNRIFSYNPRMPKFKTKKISSVREEEKNHPSPDHEIQQQYIKRKIRIFVGSFLIIFWLLFIIAYWLQAIGDVRLSSGTWSSVFKPLSWKIFWESWDIIDSKKIEWTTNILIAGIGGRWHDGAELTDSLMLASINADKWYITLLSVPRDLFVAYPKEIGWAWRINSLYWLGRSRWEWVNILANKVSEITGQSIDHYIVIDFSGFKRIVDTLWGVEIDVPSDLVDTTYPDDNWWYTTFVVRRWLQIFDGETALKYARSRHSTSDFDRSERQQLLIKAIKNKAMNAGFITNPGKLSELFEAVRDNLDTDLTLWDITNFALGLKDIESDRINVYNLSNDCVGNRCAAWAYLYNPSREYFWWASALIPENATATRLSYYEDIRRFVGFIFAFPNMKNEKAPLNIVYKKWNISKARELAMALQKVGFSMDVSWVLVESTGTIETSHVNIYWNPEANAWFPSDHIFIKALKEIEDRIPYIMVKHNEYVKTRGPRIELVLGEDATTYFWFARSAYYLPYIPTPQTNSGSSGSTVSWEGKKVSTSSTPSSASEATSWKTGNKHTWSATKTSTTTPFSVAPGEWENF